MASAAWAWMCAPWQRAGSGSLLTTSPAPPTTWPCSRSSRTSSSRPRRATDRTTRLPRSTRVAAAGPGFSMAACQGPADSGTFGSHSSTRRRRRTTGEGAGPPRATAVAQPAWTRNPRDALRPVRVEERKVALEALGIDRVGEGLGTTAIGLLEVLPPVRAASVGVAEAVLPRETPGAEDASGPPPDFRVCGQGRDRPAHEERRLGSDEVRVFSGPLAPALFGDPEAVQHRLRAQEPRGEGERGDVAPAQLPRHGHGQPDHRALHEVVEEVAAVAVGVAVGDLDDEALTALDHEGGGVTARHDVGEDGPLEHPPTLLEGQRPEGRAELGQLVAAPDVVDEHVQAALLAADPGA